MAREVIICGDHGSSLIFSFNTRNRASFTARYILSFEAAGVQHPATHLLRDLGWEDSVDFVGFWDFHVQPGHH